MLALSPKPPRPVLVRPTSSGMFARGVINGTEALESGSTHSKLDRFDEFAFGSDSDDHDEYYGFPRQEDLMADFTSLMNLQNAPEAKVAFRFPASDFQKLSLQESVSGASTQCPGGSFGNINFPGSFDSSIGTGDEFSPSSSLA
mmetsp:Transcript_58394/g.167572  ORF Transcript_58394/g.167572 Transcript_58394/m.167572 type:complete len:144 (+) Transcript_58394:24-455(+)